MQSTFLLSCKYGKLAETTEWDRSLGERKIEGTRKQPHWRSKARRASGKRVHWISIIFLCVSYQMAVGRGGGGGLCYGYMKWWMWVYVQSSDSETVLMWTIVGSRGEFGGWRVRLCWHTGISDGIVSIGKNSKNELEELSVTSLRRLWQQF